MLLPYPLPYFLAGFGADNDRMRIRMRIMSDYGYGAEAEQIRTGNGQKLSDDTCKDMIYFY